LILKRETVTNIPAEELAVQNNFIEKIAGINAASGLHKTYFISTFGCQMNAHDSEKLAGMLALMGYTAAEEEKTADIVVYKTCCVRENAENKVYGNLGYLKHVKEARPGFKIVLCGCMMQQDTVIDKIKQSYRHVDVIFGTHNLYRFPELLHANLETGGLIIDIWQEHKEIIEDLPSERSFPFKAGVNIMYGCNNFCTYCIVP
jgi:tRNA-2-methylthio-N6-dimethylallyladenosine synthase